MYISKKCLRHSNCKFGCDKSIGESMQLNAAYKPPAGYKPVYKEAKLFIPVSIITYGMSYVFIIPWILKMNIFTL